MCEGQPNRPSTQQGTEAMAHKETIARQAAEIDALRQQVQQLLSAVAPPGGSVVSSVVVGPSTVNSNDLLVWWWDPLPLTATIC